MVLYRLDPKSPVPLYSQLADQTAAAIAAKRLRPGAPLPAAKQLATELDLNQHTVLRAYAELRDRGLVEMRRGRAATVTARSAPPERVVRAARSLLTMAARAGLGRHDVIALLQGLE
jgi:GntR family transcriptional regulator